MASRTSIENATQEVTRLFSKANKNILDFIIASFTTKRVTSDTTVSLGVLKILTDLEKEAFPIVKKNIEYHYTTTIKEADRKIVAFGGKDVFRGMSEAEKIQMKALTDQALSDFGESIKGVFDSSLRVITMVKQKRLDYLVSDGALSEFNLNQLKKDIVTDLSKDFVALTDKSGRKWQLNTYAEMLSRTRFTQVSNDTMAKHLMVNGYDLVQVSTHGSDCELCGEWEGKILSLTGRTEGYDTVADAEAEGLFHPNCKHRLLPYHEIFKK